MKRAFIALALVALTGFGCSPAPTNDQADTSTAAGPYENSQYGFAFTYPDNMEVHVRSDDTRQTEHVGIPVDFFASLRDTKREDKPVNLAYFYAAPNTTTEQFVAALEASDPAVKVKSQESVTINDIAMTKIVNSTAVGTDKTYYLFDGKDGSKVIVSVFLNEDQNFDPVLQTFKTFSE